MSGVSAGRKSQKRHRASQIYDQGMASKKEHEKKIRRKAGHLFIQSSVINSSMALFLIIMGNINLSNVQEMHRTSEGRIMIRVNEIARINLSIFYKQNAVSSK